MDNTKDISQDNKRHEKWTFTYDYLGAKRLCDGHRPANRKATEEQDLPNTEIYHNYIN